MNAKLRKIDIENVLFWDLETVREHEDITKHPEALELFRYKNRNRETDELLELDDAVKLYNKKGALNLVHSKIVCLSMGFVKDGTIYVKSLTGEQFKIITEFAKVLSKGYIPCGWNIIKYDFPALRLNAFREGIIDYAPEQFNDSGKKEWNMTEVKYDVNIIDLMLNFQGTHYSPSSLAEACYLLNVPTPKDDIDGSQVSEVFYSEGVDRIAEYCQKDVVACIHIFQKMRGEELITDINYKSSAIKKDRSIPEKLYHENYFSNEIKNALKEIKFKKTDRKYVEDILISSYVRSAFSLDNNGAKDDKETEEFKINEIKTTLDEIFKK